MDYPTHYRQIAAATEALNFNMSSDVLTCSLLRTLASSKPGGRFLELGTGTGLSTSWILDGMDAASMLITIDNAPECTDVAKRFLGDDPRIEIVSGDGNEWIEKNANLRFDYIFADTWPGKYNLLNETLAMLESGGLYIIDDMLPQPNWPEGHDKKAADLTACLLQRNDVVVSQLEWATGIMIAVKKSG